MATEHIPPFPELTPEQERERWQRAFDRAETESVRPIRVQPSVFHVASVSTPGQAHVVTSDPGAPLGWACDCPAGELRLPCKHVASVIRLLEAPAA